MNRYTVWSSHRQKLKVCPDTGHSGGASDDDEQNRDTAGYREDQDSYERGSDDEVPNQPPPARLEEMPDERAKVDAVGRRDRPTGLAQHVVEDEAGKAVVQVRRGTEVARGVGIARRTRASSAEAP